MPAPSPRGGARRRGPRDLRRLVPLRLREGDGATPLSEYAHGLPAGPARDDAVALAESGLFASFVYEALEAEGNATVAALADISTGRAYAVEGSQLTGCPEWAGSVVTGRVARAADGS